MPLTPSHLFKGEDTQPLLEELLDRPIAFHRVFVKVTGSVNAAIMLSQAIYWSKRTKSKDGWFYKSRDEWEEETGLSRYEQEAARKLLVRAGVWDEELRGVPATMNFHVDTARLQDRLLSYPQLAVNQPSSWGKNPQLVGDKTPSLLGEKPPTLRLTETTTENTSENTQDERTVHALSTFEKFWTLYPKKLDRDEAKRLWLSLSVFDQIAAVDALPPWIKSKEWNDHQYIPAPSTFIRKRRWESKPSIEKPKGENLYEKARRLEREGGF